MRRDGREEDKLTRRRRSLGYDPVGSIGIQPIIGAIAIDRNPVLAGIDGRRQDGDLSVAEAIGVDKLPRVDILRILIAFEWDANGLGKGAILYRYLTSTVRVVSEEFYHHQ